MPRIDQGAIAHIGLGQRRVDVLFGARHHTADLQIHGLGEVEVALVVAGHGHDRTGAVLHEYVVGDPDGDGQARGRVQAVPAREYAGLFLFYLLPGDEVLGRGLRAVGRHVVGVVGAGDRVDQRVLR